MGVVSAGWIGEIELRLDNDCSVQRAGSLNLMDTREMMTDGLDPITEIVDGLATENAEIWMEFVA